MLPIRGSHADVDSKSTTSILDHAQPVAESSKAPWRRARMAARGAPVGSEMASPYDGWLHDSEAQAMVSTDCLVIRPCDSHAA